MSNIEVSDKGKTLDIRIGDQAMIRRYEKCCGSLDSKKILEHVDAFLSRKW